MTKKYYYDDPYRREFEGVVLSCTPCKEGYLVELDGTAFYPEGGGQPGDTGRAAFSTCARIPWTLAARFRGPSTGSGGLN